MSGNNIVKLQEQTCKNMHKLETIPCITIVYFMTVCINIQIIITVSVFAFNSEQCLFY